MKIFDIALKDLKRSFRSTFAIGMMFVAPLMITGLIYMAFGGASSGSATIQAVRVVVVNQDVPPSGSPEMGKIVVQTMGDESVSDWLNVTEATDVTAARSMVDRQEAGVAVIIPADFTQALLTGEGAPQVQLIQDPTLTIGPMMVNNMLTSVIDGATGARVAMQTEAQRRVALGLPPDPEAEQRFLQDYQQWFVGFQRSLYHGPQAAVISQPPQANTASTGEQPANMQTILGMMLAGQMIFFSFYTGASSMMSILQEEEEGTLARLFSTPTDRTIVLGGKFLAVVLMVLVQGLVMIGAGALLFKVNWGAGGSIALALIGQVLAASGLGVLLISLMKTSKQAGPILGGGLTTLGMLGGLFTVGISGMPKVFDITREFTPHGWVLQGWKTAITGGAPSQVVLPCLVGVAMGTLMFAVGAMIFRRRFA